MDWNLGAFGIFFVGLNVKLFTERAQLKAVETCSQLKMRGKRPSMAVKFLLQELAGIPVPMKGGLKYTIRPQLGRSEKKKFY
jgi:hypothetical protein